MSGIPGPAAMAGWLPLSTLWRWAVVAGARGAVGVRGLRLPNLSDSGNDLPGHPDPVAHLVSGDVVGDHPEERC